MCPLPEDVSGIEFDFVARDRDGHIALFATSGRGPFPSSVREDAQPEAELIRAFQISGKAIPEGRGPGTCVEWRQLGERGVFVFDWLRPAGPYERVISPSCALRLTDTSDVHVDVQVSGCFKEEDVVQWRT
jgi:hypothetical protein